MYDEQSGRVAAALITWDRRSCRDQLGEIIARLGHSWPLWTWCVDSGVCKQRGHPRFQALYPSTLTLQVSQHACHSYTICAGWLECTCYVLCVCVSDIHIHTHSCGKNTNHCHLTMEIPP